MSHDAPPWSEATRLSIGSRGVHADECVVELDDPARLVIAVAEAGSSMIVIGTRGQSGLRAALMGSVSQTIVGNAPAPCS